MRFPPILVYRPSEGLTQREKEVLTLTAQGKKRRDISLALSISEETVKEYIERICYKLGARNKAHASIIACIFGLIAPYYPSELVENRVTYNAKEQQ